MIQFLETIFLLKLAHFGHIYNCEWFMTNCWLISEWDAGRWCRSFSWWSVGKNYVNIEIIRVATSYKCHGSSSPLTGQEVPGSSTFSDINLAIDVCRSVSSVRNDAGLAEISPKSGYNYIEVGVRLINYLVIPGEGLYRVTLVVRTNSLFIPVLADNDRCEEVWDPSPLPLHPSFLEPRH